MDGYNHRALLLKWKWRYVSNPLSLWVNVINNIYNPVSFGDWSRPGVTSSGIWYNVLKVASDLDEERIIPRSAFSIKVGNGSSILFWHDIWSGNLPFALKFPHLFNLECDKRVSVCNRWRDNKLLHNWRRNVRGGAEETELKELVSALNSVEFSNDVDKWVFSVDNLNEFSVKEIRLRIDSMVLPVNIFATRWNNMVPRKVNIHAWRVLLDRIPTRKNLVTKGLDIPSLLCPMCECDVETSDHVFGNCNVASRVWRAVSNWIQIPIPSVGPTDMLNDIDNMHLSLVKKNIIEGIVYCGWWSIWRYRNDKVFKNGIQRKDYLVDIIISHSYSWFSSRFKKRRMSWVEWLSNPLCVV
uniref:uncharacterized protein LOC122586145 n=1 Tax=Erigeron canadensis TaxID=72917 RepID=UPI001CB998E5|nr:uncharacterized protein LOC122586145 [Erigeron canadensis]